MSSSASGLLIITQMRTILNHCVEVLIKSAGPYVDRKLYVALHENVAKKMGQNDGIAFDFIADVYRASSIICKPSLDVRILLESMKVDFLKPERKSDLFHRIYRDVDWILIEKGAEFTCKDQILEDVGKSGSKPRVVELSVPENASVDEIGTTFVGESGCETSASICKYSGVVLGGTFDHIHNGHKILLSTALLLAKDRLTCGVTDEPMLQRKVLPELIAPVEERIKNVSALVSDIDSTVIQKIVPIVDAFGPSIVDTDLQAIVASRETLRGTSKVNEERLKKGLSKLDPFICDLVEDSIADMCADPEKKVSSSKMRQQLLGELLRKPVPNANVPSRPYVIGLTGGIASGKSHIAKYLESLGAYLVDCDQLGHKAYLPGTDTYKRVVSTFGDEVVDHSNGGVINRKVLGEKVFSNPGARQRLNQIVWPEIMRVANDLIKKAAADGAKIAVLDAAILLEAGWDASVHEVWVAVVPPDEAVKRMQERNKLTKEQATARLQSQMPNKDRVARANVVFCSLWEYSVTRAQVKKAWDNLITRLP